MCLLFVSVPFKREQYHHTPVIFCLLQRPGFFVGSHGTSQHEAATWTVEVVPDDLKSSKKPPDLLGFLKQLQ